MEAVVPIDDEQLCLDCNSPEEKSNLFVECPQRQSYEQILECIRKRARFGDKKSIEALQRHDNLNAEDLVRRL